MRAPAGPRRRRRQPARSAPRVGAAVLAGALLLAACTRVEVRSEPDAAVVLRAAETFAWEGAAEPGSEDVPVEAVGPALSDELVARGYRRAPAGDAALLVSFRLGVETEVVEQDPFYAPSIAVRREIGVLTVEILDAGTDELVWTGAARRRLRVLAYARGGTSVDFVPVDEPRAWNVPEMAREIVARLPR